LDEDPLVHAASVIESATAIAPSKTTFRSFPRRLCLTS